jgi:hypothetical protein
MPPMSILGGLRRPTSYDQFADDFTSKQPGK